MIEADTTLEVETEDGSIILIEEIDGQLLWRGCAGMFTSDDLRDIAAALEGRHKS